MVLCYPGRISAEMAVGNRQKGSVVPDEMGLLHLRMGNFDPVMREPNLYLVANPRTGMHSSKLGMHSPTPGHFPTLVRCADFLRCFRLL